MASSTLPWSGTAVSPLVALLAAGNYPTEEVDKFITFFKQHVVPLLGPHPAGHPTEMLPISFMCDDGSTIEFSVVVDGAGNAVVRFAIEPVEVVAGGGVTAQDPRAIILEMIENGTIDCVDWEWFNICQNKLAISDFHFSPWHALASQNKLQHKSQYFLGYDLGRDGRLLIKAYFIPHIRSSVEGKSTQALIGETCGKLGLSTPWNALADFTAERPFSPEFAITAIDLLPADKNRFKIYVRASRAEMSFRDLRSYFTLNGRLESREIDQALEQLWLLWKLLFPCDDSTMSREEQESRVIPALHNGNANTAALCMYYDLRKTAPLPAPKVYIPVRHFCESDTAIAKAFSQFYQGQGKFEAAKLFGVDATAAFPPVAPTIGRHTYISCAIKNGGHEFSAYYSSMAYAQPAP